ncbi:putative amino-acid transporter [Streptomyces afghaniensis 772]|uniref:Putative amino-acid transporter n=1 Tax=Streptomyces afghaniensis 772 TaxID=1283301 RepID=S4N3H1_9ACTN|nr:putative amino-acid transporter [Streptomyces afghaniensis 772]
MTSTFTAGAAGFGTGLSLIVAIGAQNAFVLRQGIRRDAVLAVVGICALSDAALIALGVGGVARWWWRGRAHVTAIGWIGASFLLCYGALAARRVLRPDGGALKTEGEAAGSMRRAVLTCLAMTWLNPHVYLDTVFLLGSVAADHGPLARGRSAFGAVRGQSVRGSPPRLRCPHAWPFPRQARRLAGPGRPGRRHHDRARCRAHRRQLRPRLSGAGRLLP